MKLNSALHHLSFAVAHPFHVRGYRTCLDAVLSAVARKPIRLCAPDHVLAGQARNVRALSANVFSLDNSRAAPGLGKVPGEVFSRLATADHKDFVVLDFRHESSPPA